MSIDLSVYHTYRVQGKDACTVVMREFRIHEYPDDAVPENSQISSPSPATDNGGEEEEERRARIDGTLDEVVEASSSVVFVVASRRRQLVFRR